jgi:holo-[acyl-carrier protein] synthase
MIFGIGTDLCDVRRIEATFQRQGERFVRKVLGDAEVLVWQQRSARSAERGMRYLATRFSAKEAFSKAVGLGMRLPMTWRRCEITNAPSGQPQIVLHGDLKQWFEAQGLKAHVSVTDETDYAASYVVVERVGGASVSAPPPLVVPASAPVALPSAAEPVASVEAPAFPAPPAPTQPTVSHPAAAADDRSILGRFGGQL